MILILIFLTTSVFASSHIPAFWENPYISHCLEENPAPDIQATIKALKEISGSQDCHESFRKLQEAQSFVLIKKGISNLYPLAPFTNLRGLYLTDNQIADLSPLENLTSLDILFLSNNALVNISPLGQLKNLKALYITDNQIQDVSDLANLWNLKTLFMERNPIIKNRQFCPTDSMVEALNRACQKHLDL